MNDRSTTYAVLGRFVEDRIDQLGLSKKAVADAAGMSTANLREIMRGVVRDRPGATWTRLAVALQWPDDCLRLVASGDKDTDWLISKVAAVPLGSYGRPIVEAPHAPPDFRLLEYALAVLPPERQRDHLASILADAMEVVITEMPHVAFVEAVDRLSEVVDQQQLLDAISAVAKRVRPSGLADDLALAAQSGAEELGPIDPTKGHPTRHQAAKAKRQE